MSQRKSGWERKPNEFYQTPTWCTETLVPHLPSGHKVVWEPACGGGLMSEVLNKSFDKVIQSDKELGGDFLSFERVPEEATAIITNPPYNQAQVFIEHALKLMQPCKGTVAMLLRVDFDSAKTRAHIFADHPAWWKKLVFRKRVVWFAGEKSPSYNHAFYLWNWRHDGSPATIAYGP